MKKWKYLLASPVLISLAAVTFISTTSCNNGISLSVSTNTLNQHYSTCLVTLHGANKNIEWSITDNLGPLSRPLHWISYSDHNVASLVLIPGFEVIGKTYVITATVGSNETQIEINTDNYATDAKNVDGSDWVGAESGSLVGVCDTVKHTYTITDGSTYHSTNLQMPDLVKDGDGVCYTVQIGDDAFKNNVNIKGSFNVSPYTTQIGSSAFEGCTALTSIALGDSMQRLGASAFKGCIGLTGIVYIPTNVKDITDSLFEGCTHITEVVLSNHTSLIGDDAFAGCTNLTVGKIPWTVQSIGARAFKNTKILSVSNEFFEDADSSSSKLSIIGAEAFSGAFVSPSSSITDLILPVNLHTIDDSAFYGCTGLFGNLIIPDHISTIGASTFEGCSNLNGDLQIASGTHALMPVLGEKSFKGTDFDAIYFFPIYSLENAGRINDNAFLLSSTTTGHSIHVGLTTAWTIPNFKGLSDTYWSVSRDL